MLALLAIAPKLLLKYYHSNIKKIKSNKWKDQKRKRKSKHIHMCRAIKTHKSRIKYDTHVCVCFFWVFVLSKEKDFSFVWFFLRHQAAQIKDKIRHICTCLLFVTSELKNEYCIYCIYIYILYILYIYILYILYIYIYCIYCIYIYCIYIYIYYI